MGKIEQGYCTINSWGNTANRAFIVETGSVKEIWCCLLSQPKKAVPQKKNGTQIHKSVPGKVNNSLPELMYCLLSASWHFLFHTGSNISLVKNNASLVISRNICRKSGQYSYLYTASLQSPVIVCTSWVFFTFNNTYHKQCVS